MTSLPRGLVVLGFIVGLAVSAQTAAAAAPAQIHLADDVSTDTPTDPSADPASSDLSADPSADPSMAVATETPVAVPTETPTPTPTATPTVIPTATATPTVNPAALQQVIQHSNDEQVQAIATRNVSLLTDTVTADHFPEIASALQDLLNHQVTGIALLKMDLGPIAVASDGSSATATTYETWRIISQAGTIDYDPVRNDYTLVLDNGTWKIKSDVILVVPPQR